MLFTQISLLSTALLALAPSAYGHMIMATPVPFGAPNNSPLSSDGSDYPCKIGGSGSYDVKTMNEFKVGEKQTLSFTGTAVHGGGSCQLAVTLDKEPTKQSKFKVIYSIVGGCPGVGGPSTFDFTVPKELPNGQAVLSWIWFNKIGNREMYMNCAPITVSGGSDDKAAFEALPDMAIANIQGQGTCKTPESSDYTFEKPGEYVTTIGNGPFVPLCGGAAVQPAPGMASTAPPAASQTPNNPGMYTPPASQASQAPAAPSASGSQAPPAEPAPSSTLAAPAPPQATSTIRTLITVTASSGLVSTAPAAQPSQAPSGNGSCATDGAVICNGEDQFGLCDHGKVVFQPVAAGTKCQNGAIAKRDFTHRAQRTVV